MFFIQFLFFVFCLASIIQLLYWLFLFSKLAFYKEKPISDDDDSPPVSIIICARNEAENLEKNLPRILNQNYRFYEVIVVDDNSTDNTFDILLNFTYKYPILCAVKAGKKPKNRKGKKHAMTVGIQTAKYDLVLLTDADCYPNSKNWLNEMQKCIRRPMEVGLGYGPYFPSDGFLNKFIRYETVYTAVQYLSFALAGLPYMGVGRNLIYYKNLFKQVNGFSKHEHIASGDDDLFIKEVANKNNTCIVLAPETFVYSEAKKDYKSYFFQKQRHLSTARHYTIYHQLLLGLLAFSHFLHYTTGFLLLILKFSTMFVVVFFIYVARILVMLFLYAFILRRLQETKLLFWIPLLDLSYILFYLIFAPTLTIGNSSKWKYK